MIELFNKAKEKVLLECIDTTIRIVGNIPKRVFLRYKIKSLIEDQFFLIEQGNINDIRTRTLIFVETMRIKDKPFGMFKYSASQKQPVLYTSCYAALIRHLYGDMENLTKQEKKEWINYILSFQCQDGLFRDSSIKNDIAENCDWWGWRHLTLHCIMALNALGAKPNRRFSIIKPFKDERFVIRWLQNRDWIVDPATTSNMVQNYLTLLQHGRDFQGEDWAEKSLEVAYQWLDNKQDINTGLWGTKFDRPEDLSNGVQTGYHIWLLYFYDKREIKHKEKIIESCLKTQNKLGGFGVPLNSSACEDIDSIDPLCRFYFFSNHKKNTIVKSLRRSLIWLFANMNKDGGFVFRREEPFFYGHQLMSSHSNESAMLPTWFRTLSLAYLSKVLDDTFIGKFDWKFLGCPGYQFWNMPNE